MFRQYGNKVRIHRASKNTAQLKTEDGRVYFVNYDEPADMTFVTRISPPYNYIAAEYIGKKIDESIHAFFGGREELFLSCLPLYAPRDLSGWCK